MANHGVEDARTPLRRSCRLQIAHSHLKTNANKTAVVNAPLDHRLPIGPTHRKPRQSSLPCLGLYPQGLTQELIPLTVSGIPQNHILPSSLSQEVITPHSNCVCSANTGARRCSSRSARHASIAPSGVSTGPTSLQPSAFSSPSLHSCSLVLISSQCHSNLPLCPLETSQRPLCCLPDPLRVGSGLLGKRASSPQLSTYPTCPSPPKSSVSHRRMVVVVTTDKASLPASQSSSWSNVKLREANSSNGVIVNGVSPQRPTSASLPSSHPRPHARPGDPGRQPSFPLSDCSRGDDKGDGCMEVKMKSLPIATVPSDEKSEGCPILKDETHLESEKRSRKPTHTPLQTQSVNPEAKFTMSVHKAANSSSNLHASRTNCCTNKSVTAISAASTSPPKMTSPAHWQPPEPTLSCTLKVEGRNHSTSQKESSHNCHVASTERGANPEGDITTLSGLEIPPALSVYSVTSDLSSIHLTRKGNGLELLEESSLTSGSALRQESAEMLPGLEPQGQETVAVPPNEKEELPNDLESDCSGDDNDASDCCSMSTDAALDTAEEAVSVEEPMSTEVEDERVERPALVPSLFPLMPSTLYFSTANEKVEMLPPDQRKLLKWKMSTVTPNVVKHTIARSHFKATKKSHDWLGCWGHHMKSPGFKTIKEHQKLNHFPGSFQIGRKDRLWRNLSKMQARFGKREFNFFPRTFVLPQDIKLLRKAWEDGGGRQKWIVKPPASARGIGIQVIHKWSQMPRQRPLLVQKYIQKPYLIGGNKFDLRIYVYVTSYDPLRIYIFDDGLVRFASCKYSSSMKTLGNKFMHLTNYSVNKKNSEYQSNSDDKACQGHKWALKALWHYLGSKGVNTTQIWEKIKDIVIKTIIASESYVNTLVKMHVRSPYSCHELFGFDIMLDEKLKPWILEVNISPSLHSNTALDVAIKGQMIRDVLNLAGFVLPTQKDIDTPAPSTSACSSTSSLHGGGRERSRSGLSTDEKVKRAFYLSQRFADQEFFATVLEVLTPDDVRVLAETEDEATRQGQFQRLFPSPTSSRYLRFFEHPRYLNILLNQWEQAYCHSRTKGIDLLWNLCQRGVHQGNLSDTVHHWSSKPYLGRVHADPGSNPHARPEPTKSSVVVTFSGPTAYTAQSAASADDQEVLSFTSSLPDMSALASAITSPSLSPSPSPTPSSSTFLSTSGHM